MNLTFSVRIIREHALNLFIILFMSQKSFMTLNNFMFGQSSGIYRLLKYVIYMTMFVLLFIALPAICNRIKKNAVFAYAFIFILFLFTYLFADGAREVINEEELFVNIFILALPGLVLVRTINDFDSFLATLRITGYFVVCYSALIVLFGDIGDGYMGFSYSILIYIIALLYCGLFQKNKVALAFGLIGTIVDISAGTRGSLICLLTLLIAFMLLSKRWGLCVFITCCTVAFAVSFDNILSFVSSALNNFGINSRIIDALQGTGLSSLSYANGRISILNASMDLIKENWLTGYGFLGERAFLDSKIWWFTTNGYAHNIGLEIILQFGIIFGSFLIIALVYRIICYLKNFENNAMCGITMIYLCYCAHLLVSRSYTTTFEFWVLLGLLMLYPSRIQLFNVLRLARKYQYRERSDLKNVQRI